MPDETLHEFQLTNRRIIELGPRALEVLAESMENGDVSAAAYLFALAYGRAERTWELMQAYKKAVREKTGNGSEK